MLQELLGARKQLGLTQVEMAKKLGISRNYLALIETEQRKIPASVADWLVTFLKQKSGEPLNSSADPPGAETVICHDKLRLAPCPLCAEKSARIGELERELTQRLLALCWCLDRA